MILPRKWKLTAHDQRVVFQKGFNESAEHVVMKALLWALYLPTYPDITVEIRIGDRYKPDLVSLDTLNQPRFWGEAGKVGVDKIRSLTRRYRDTHFVIAKWNQRIDTLEAIVSAAIGGHERNAPFDLIRFPANSYERFIDAVGNVNLSHDDIEWLQLGI
jgi:hypothetical protein